MPLCRCPLPASLPDIAKDACPVSFGQIQKVAFQRLSQIWMGSKRRLGMAIDGDSNGDPHYKTAWTDRIAATDNGKALISPYLQAPATEVGAARTFGGGNETPGGIPIVLGREATSFTAFIRQMSQDKLTLWKQLECESDLGVYLFDENGNIGGILEPYEGYPTLFPIPIRSLFFGDLTLGGFEGVDSNGVQWSFLPDWSNNLTIITPIDFNPLTDLS